MSIGIKVGDTWLHSLGSYVVDEVVDRWPGGCWSLKWSMSLTPGEHPPALVANALVEAFVGGKRWAGRLAEPDWEEGTFHADGLVREGESAIAVDGDGNPTTNPGTGIFWASSRGAVSWGSLEVFTAVTDSAGMDANYLSPLLDAYCDSIGRRWRVDEHKRLWVSADPTTPSLFLAPGIGDLGASKSVQVTDLSLMYLRKSNLRVERVRSPQLGSGVTPRMERIVSLVDLGPMTQTQAQAHATGIMAKVGPQVALTGGIEVGYGQVTNRHGVPVDMHRVRAGVMVRSTGVRDPRNGAPHTDFVLGETSWNPSTDTVSLAPVDSVATDLAGVVETLGGQVVA